MNIHFDNPLQSLTKQTLSTLSLYSLVQIINKPTHSCGHIIDWVIVRPDDDIHRKSTVTYSLESDHYCTKSYFNISVSKPSTLYRTVRNIAKVDRPPFFAELYEIYALLLKYWKNLSYPKFLPTSTLTIFTILVNRYIVQVTALKQLF